MPTKISTIAEIDAYLALPKWDVFARWGEYDRGLVLPNGYRERNGIIEINPSAAIVPTSYEYELTRDEWIVPTALYAVYQCEGCHYPPSMCCETREHHSMWYDDMGIFD